MPSFSSTIDLAIETAGPQIVDFGSTARSVGYVKEEEHQHQLLTDRVHTMVAKLANNLKTSGPKDP
ncbi:hypothetical protein N8943_02140, partial [Aquiluna sp.]|nr:hypothetical protein [Aquiluna sp.]